MADPRAPRNPSRHLIPREDARAAWLLLLEHQAVPIFVAETASGFVIGQHVGRGSRRAHVLAGYFNCDVLFDDFHDAIEAAAAESMEQTA